MIPDLYRAMYRIRRVEEEIARVYPTDVIRSPVHLSTGQEAVAVGVCAALRPTDVIFATYRGHAAYLAKGGDLRRMIAELYGRATGCCGGKGGSMHLCDPEAGVMLTSAIVGTPIPNAVGYAYALKLRKEKRVVAVFFGDGATDEGVFHESLNFAALRRLPVLFVCENNGWADETRQRDRQRRLAICERVQGYGIRATEIWFNNVMATWSQTSTETERLRQGEGPAFLEVKTCRWKEHVGVRPGDSEEVQAWIEADQLAKLAKTVGERERMIIQATVDAEVQEAFQRAESDPFPEPEALLTDVVGG